MIGIIEIKNGYLKRMKNKIIYMIKLEKHIKV